MNKIDATVKKETIYIASWVALLSAVLQAIFLIGGRWDYTVLTGNLLSAFVAISNFLLLGLSVQKAIGKEEKQAKSTMQLSQSLRMFYQFGVAAVGVLLPVFNTWTVLIPLFFPRIAIMLRPLFDKKM